MRPAKDSDLPAINVALNARPEVTMFLRSNLAAHGLHDRTAPDGMQVFITDRAGGIGVFAISNDGFLLASAPQATPQDWANFARALAGHRIAGMTGPVPEVTAAMIAFGFGEGHFAMTRDEPLYRLSLDALRLPVGGEFALRKAHDTDRGFLIPWFTDYEMETLSTPPDRAKRRAFERTEAALASDRMRVLCHEGTPVAMTAWNAQVDGMVQIGGVFTPAALRGRGYARRAVAMHLDEGRKSGVTSAILFASGPAACRAYEAIGFQEIGQYRLALLTEPKVLDVTT